MQTVFQQMQAQRKGMLKFGIYEQLEQVRSPCMAACKPVICLVLPTSKQQRMADCMLDEVLREEIRT